MYFHVDANITYAYTLSGRGLPVMFLHGFTGCGASWQQVTRGLEDHYRLLLPDLLGHGASSAPSDPSLYRMELAAVGLASLVDAVVGEPVHLVAYSMGGRLALYFALEYPERVRSLVLESASPGLETASERAARRAADEALAEQIITQGITAFVDRWEKLPLFASQSSLPEEVRLQLRQQRLRNRPEGLAGSLRGMGTGAQPSLWAQLSALRCPTLLLAGELDEKFLGINRRMAGLIPGARFEIISHAGHTTHLEQPEGFGEHLRDFWGRAGRGRPYFTFRYGSI